MGLGLKFDLDHVGEQLASNFIKRTTTKIVMKNPARKPPITFFMSLNIASSTCHTPHHCSMQNSRQAAHVMDQTVA
jgi:hypothetical protein